MVSSLTPLAPTNLAAVTSFSESYAARVDLEIVLKYVGSNYPELISKLPKLAQEYRKYIFLIATGLFENMPTPCEGVSKIWCAHMHHGDIYSDFCQRLCGRYIENISNET